MLIFWKKAAESEVISSVVIGISTAVDHQDSVSHWIALSCVGVTLVRQQRGDAHHLCGLLGFLELVFPC